LNGQAAHSYQQFSQVICCGGRCCYFWSSATGSRTDALDALCTSIVTDNRDSKSGDVEIKVPFIAQADAPT
jgi:hypothetical protein